MENPYFAYEYSQEVDGTNLKLRVEFYRNDSNSWTSILRCNKFWIDESFLFIQYKISNGLIQTSTVETNLENEELLNDFKEEWSSKWVTFNSVEPSVLVSDPNLIKLMTRTD